MDLNDLDQPVGDLVRDWSARARPGGVGLRGRHVWVEAIGPSHVGDLFEALCGPQDRSLWTYRPAPMPASVEELSEAVVSPRTERSGDATFVVVPVGGAAAGLATLSACAPASGRLEISGVLWARSMRRSTSATEAIHLLLEHAFDQLGYRRVEWKCDSLNAASRRAAERLGFTYEGRFRQHMVIEGRNRDTDWYSLLDAEWPAIRERNLRWLAPKNFDANGRQRHRLTDL